MEIILVKALNELIKNYNNKVEGINFTDVRDFENYIISKGIDIKKTNSLIKLKNK